MLVRSSKKRKTKKHVTILLQSPTKTGPFPLSINLWYPTKLWFNHPYTEEYSDFFKSFDYALGSVGWLPTSLGTVLTNWGCKKDVVENCIKELLWLSN